jgi:fucose permease
MSLHRLSSLIEVESGHGSQIANPTAAVCREDRGSRGNVSTHELGELSGGKPVSSGTKLCQLVAPATPDELERSSPPSPKENEAADEVQTFTNPPMNQWRLLSACLMSFGGGLNDSIPGAIIPYIEKEYDVGYAVVSLIFVANALGFILAAPCTFYLENRLGRSRVYMLSFALLTATYATIICGPPFPVVVLGFFLLGLGLATNLALNNVFCANLANRTMALGGLHGGYGIGGTVGPLMATAIASNGTKWPFVYFISLGISMVNLAFAGWSFWNYEKDLPAQLNAGTQQTSQNDTEAPSKKQLLKQAVKNRVTILGALFIFAYQGAEVSISGWVVSFLISYRNGDPSKVGYVSAGFWAGVAIGRFLLSHPAHKFGEKVSVVALIASSLVFQLLVWLVPNVIGDAVAVSIVGLLLGPVYPCAASVFTVLVPRSIQISSIGFISAMGSSGGAIAPFFTGLLAQRFSTVVLHPICVGLYVSMVICWLYLPRVHKKE